MLGTVALSVLVVVVTERAGARAGAGRGGRRPIVKPTPDMSPKTLAGDRAF